MAASVHDRPSDRLIGAKQAAELLGVNRATVINWAKLGRFPALQYGTGRLYRFREADILAFIEQSRMPVAGEGAGGWSGKVTDGTS